MDELDRAERGCSGSRRSRWRRGAFGTSLLLVLSATASRANDFILGGSGADLVPLQETRVRMASEDIVMRYVDGRVRVVADYLFENPTSEDLALQVGFPEFACDPKTSDDDCAEQSFWGLTTTVDGEPAQHRLGTLAKPQLMADFLGKVWLFDARFPPGQTTSIRHSYDVFMGSNLSFIDSADYVTQTGRGWAGKIGKARFRVMLPPATHTVWVDRWGKPRWVERGAEPAHWELEFEATDWVPPRGIGATFQHSVWGPVDLGADRLSRSGVRAEDECPSSPVAPDTAKQRRMCVNLIYALSGYPFVNPQLAKYFYGNPFDWRVEKAPYSDEERVYRRGLRPRADFDVSWITSIDRSILRYLATLEFPGEASDPIDVPAASAANREEDERADRRLQAILKQPAPETTGTSSPTKPEPPTPQTAETSSPTKPEPPLPLAPTPQAPTPARGCGACGPFGTQGVAANRFAGALVALAGLAWARSRMRGRTRPDER